MKRSYTDALFMTSHNYWTEKAMASRTKGLDISNDACKEFSEKESLPLAPLSIKSSSSSTSLPSILSDASVSIPKFPSTSSLGSSTTEDSESDSKDSISTDKHNKIDVRGPQQVSVRVQLVVGKWAKTIPIAPIQYLLNLLKCRGYESDLIPSLASPFRRDPSPKQMQDYENDLVWAVRNSDLTTLQKLQAEGRNMSACNRFSESIVHMACRRGDFQIVSFLLSNGGSHNIVDDFGRTPLHDACWRPEPRFDVVTLLLEKDLTLLRLVDVRGSAPLNYVREEHWLQWCAYFYHQKEKYWAVRDEKTLEIRRDDISNFDKMPLQESFNSTSLKGPVYWEPSDVVVDSLLKRFEDKATDENQSRKRVKV